MEMRLNALNVKKDLCLLVELARLAMHISSMVSVQNAHLLDVHLVMTILLFHPTMEHAFHVEKMRLLI